ncbi:D-alanine--D-alanine ligase family protein [Pseudonocardia thermophila]|uniref:D-alanine--D-alanine ligase family protein n=1 Tax=Pseudonocardia thermophila TaxID=1848 RepID=UPI0009373888|nr:D-alanine--D-alanine ligase family protein [Pseudonocardia thermophila]
MSGRRTRVAVVFGGRSSEHAVSCVSGGAVLSHIDRERFDVVPVGITPSGAWVLVPDDPEALRIADRSLPSVDEAGRAVTLTPVRPALVTLEPGQVSEVLAEVDVVFPVLHGPYGEDGTIQGLLEMVGVPYVGAGVLASAVSMDKEFTKKVLAAAGLPIGDYVALRSGTLDDAQRERLGLPVFVKPARGGSSIGVSKVHDWADLAAALETARTYDPKVLVEAAIDGREIECAVLEFPDGAVRASVPAEIRVVGKDGVVPEFYDFETKYLDDVCEFDVPAKLDDAEADRLRELAVAAFHAVDAQGLARVDFFYTRDGRMLVNEVNTMPGFTPISMYPRAWAVTGIDFATLVTTLIETALARGTGLR